jgi:hypothetical protein
MLNMNRPSVNVLDLPNEVLFYILRKLDNRDVLYSLFGIKNKRFDNIARDKTFSNTLDLALTNHETTIVDSILDKFCNRILPQIYYNIKCLVVRSASMERILIATQYPCLTELKLVDFQQDSSLHYFTGY